MKSPNFAGLGGRLDVEISNTNIPNTGIEKRSLRRARVLLLASAVFALGAGNALAAHHKPAASHGKKSSEGGDGEHGKHEGKHDKKNAEKKGGGEHKHVVAQPADEQGTPLSPTLAAVKEAAEMLRHGKGKDALALAAATGDPVAAKVIEWAWLRHADNEAGFERYASFIRNNPDWPVSSIRRRAEGRLWQERRDGATVHAFTGDRPTSAAGRLALARVEIAEGNRPHAEGEVRAVWQSEPLTAEMETAVLAAFPDMLTRADHVARMDKRIGAKDFGAATRAAKLAGEDHVAIVKACSGAESKKGGSPEVHADLHGDLAYSLCKLHHLLRNDAPGNNMKGKVVTPKGDYEAAVKLVLSASPEDLKRQDTDEWWRERRSLARKLLDIGAARTAYEVARTAAPPTNPYYRAETHFMAGWIALRFLNDPATALTHFAHVDDGAVDPLTIARAQYWRGRALEAAGQAEDMRKEYEGAAGYPTTYYGQLARARLGHDDVVEVRQPPEPPDSSTSEVLRAAEMLYKTGEGNLAMAFATDVGQDTNDPAVISGVGKVTARYKDAQAMLQLGKGALGRGMAMDHYAFPDIGVPNYTSVAPPLDRCVVYAITRTESGFDPGDKSAAQAVGLMQVTPSAGRDTAKRYGVSYSWDRLVNDSVYNTQMGAAELSGLLKDYRGSYILTFAGYNAGRGRVEQWMALHGDPRDPKVDAVDWVERIPFSETRNYVQRVMENLQVYRKRFGDPSATVEPNLHRAAMIGGQAQAGKLTPTVELTPPNN
jgi:soluble lytic murein transglycosylase